MQVIHSASLIMAPGILAPEPTFVVTPMTKTPKEKHNFGAVITGIDLEDITGKRSLRFSSRRTDGENQMPMSKHWQMRSGHIS